MYVCLFCFFYFHYWTVHLIYWIKCLNAEFQVSDICFFYLENNFSFPVQKELYINVKNLMSFCLSIIGKNFEILKC